MRRHKEGAWSWVLFQFGSEADSTELVRQLVHGGTGRVDGPAGPAPQHAAGPLHACTCIHIVAKGGALSGLRVASSAQVMMRKVQCADWLSDTVSQLETQVGICTFVVCRLCTAVLWRGRTWLRCD